MPKKCDEDGCTILLAPGIPYCGIHGRYKKPHKQSKMEEYVNEHGKDEKKGTNSGRKESGS